MKKSPLSMPSGSRGNQGYGWKSRDHKNNTGYGYIKSDSYQCMSPSQNQTHQGDDFIPLNMSTPQPEQKRHSGNNWYGSGGNRNHRNSGSGGFNHYRNNYHASPKSNFNNSYSPYKHTGKQFHGQKKGYQRDNRKQVDISKYIDMKSFLEDPWAELTKKLNESNEAIGEISPRIDRSFSSPANCVDYKLYCERKATIELDDSQYSQESRNESSIDVTLGLTDTDISELSKAESSVDLKLDNVKFSQDSKNESLCSNNDSDSEDIQEDKVLHFCNSQTSTIQESI